jgi:hypothetical protein
VEDIEGQWNQVWIEVGRANRHDLAPGGRADSLGVDPVGRHRTLRPDHDDRLCGVERARDFRAELIATPKPGLVPPN